MNCSADGNFLSIQLFLRRQILGNHGDDASFARILECKTAKLPIKYLGVPLGAKYEDKKN